MQEYTVICRKMPLTFKGDLLAEGDTNNYKRQNKWTHFAIYYTDNGKYILTVTCKFADGGENQRTFICDGFFQIAKNLAHPAYGTISFRGQEVYYDALEAAVESGLIEDAKPFQLTEKECGNGKVRYIKKYGELPKRPAPEKSEYSCDNGEDFDFSED